MTATVGLQFGRFPLVDLTRLGGRGSEDMKRLVPAGVCVAVLVLVASTAGSASATVPTWFECHKAAKSAKSYIGSYDGKLCEEASEVDGTGKYELLEGVGKAKAFKGKGGQAVLHVTTSLGDNTVQCTSSRDTGKPALPNLETGVVITYKGCTMLGSKRCNSAGASAGEVAVAALKGELVLAEESPNSAVELKLESAAHPGPGGEMAQFSCEGLQATITGELVGTRSQDINVVDRESEISYAAQGQTVLDKGEALMVKTKSLGSEGSSKVRLIGQVVEHNIGGDAKKEEITPVKFVAQKSGTVEEISFETSGYQHPPNQTSLVLGIQEQIGGKPGKVLGQGTYDGELGLNAIATVGGLSVPIIKGKVYYLTFLPLGGTITYWYSKAETIIYSVDHTQLEEGPPQNYEWRTEAHEAPIGIWASGTP
jgi:hypothetical protein